MTDGERYPVLVTDEERTRAYQAMQLLESKLDTERGRLQALDVDTGSLDAVLATVKGDGAGGGLLQRFKPRDDTRELWPDRPEGDVRQLRDPDPPPDREDHESEEAWNKAMDAWEVEGAAVVQEPVEEDAWGPLQGVLEAVEEDLERTADDCRYYVEDEDGQVWRVAIQVDVGVELVGRRPAQQVEEAVQASVEVDQKQEASATKLAQLRNLAVRIIHDLTAMPVPVREEAVAYAEATEDKAWLKAWADGERPEVPDGWEAQEEPEQGPSWEDLSITKAARELAEEIDLGPAELEGQGTGKGGRIKKGDVEDVNNALINRAAQQRQGD